MSPINAICAQNAHSRRLFEIAAFLIAFFAALIPSVICQTQSQKASANAPGPGKFVLSDIPTGRSIEEQYTTRCAITAVVGQQMILNTDVCPPGARIGLYHNEMTVFDNGGEHTFLVSEIDLFDYTFKSDPSFPLIFKLIKDKGYVYLSGKGKIINNKDGHKTNLGGAMTYAKLSIGLKSTDQLTREGSALGLGYLGNERAVSLLIDVLGDASYEVRRNATESLGRLGSEKAIPALIKQVDAKNDVAKTAIWALGNCGKKGMAALKKIPDTVTDDALRADALKTIESIQKTSVKK